MIGTCAGCERPFALELDARKYELIDAHPGWPSDDLARVAEGDYLGWITQAFVKQYE